MDLADLSKLTVAKLRGLCKEKGLSNYWKVPKAALLAKLADAGLVSINGNPYSAPSQPAKENGRDRQINADNLLASDIPSSSTGSSILGLDTSPLLHAPEERLEFSTGPTVGCNNIEPPSASQTTVLSTTVNILPAVAGSKRPSETVLSTSSNLVNHMASKRQKTSSKPNQLKESKVPEKPVRFHQLSPANDLGICTSQHRSAAQSFTSTSIFSSLPKILPDRVSENMPKISQTSASTTPSLLNVSSAAPSILPTLHQRNASSVTDIAPLSHNPSSFIPPSVPERPRIGLSRNIVASSSNLPSRASSTLTDYIINKSQSQSQQLRFNPPRPSSTPRVLNQGQIHATGPQVSPGYTSAIPQAMEAAILPNLKSIPLPPSISQRKRLSLLSLALCYLNDEERMTCVLVSKLFRYAVYLSAQDILNRSFSGKRLSRLICSLPSRNLTLKMTNLWPYLRLRQKEVRRRKKAYGRGWVAKYFRETGSPATPAMTEKLWTSPDCEEQFSVVQRFIQTRLCFALSFHGMGGVSARWVSSTVVEAQEVLANEVWSITVTTSSPENGTGDQVMTYYVLYQTCEVIGHPPSDSLADPDNCASLDRNLMPTGSCRIPLRADWSAYIARRLPPVTRHLYLPLLEHVRGTNTDDFEGGVAKGWLKQLRSQGKEGKEKLLVTERYILGCVVGNSVSGAYKSTARMALEFAGLNDIRDNGTKGERQSAPEVNLFLPERHNVESVHFASPRGALHPALAVVQTAGRQDGSFVLRENGVLIGENEQVPEMWMKLLGCTANGMMSS